MIVPQPAGPLPKANLRLYLVLGSLSMLGPLSLDMYLPAFPTLTRELGAGQAAIQLTITGCLVGLAIGQVIAGPLSDSLGRRRPLLAGLIAYAACSAICALAPSAAILAGARVFQGLAGGAALVIATASVRDRYSGREAARFFSLLVLISGVAPIVAPSVGSELLRFTSWRGIFMILAAIGVLLTVAVATNLAESLPPARRRAGGLKDATGSLSALVRARPLMAYAVPMGIAYAAFFAYLASSSFVIQEVYGASPQQFGLIFAMIAIGFITSSQINGQLVRRFAPERLMSIGLAGLAVATVALLLETVTRAGGLPGLLAPMFFAMCSLGFIGPNAQALALTGYPRAAGAGSAVLGLLRFGIGAAVAPIAGLIASGSAVPMGVLMATLGLAAGGSFLLLRARPPQPRTPSTATTS